MKAEHGQAAFSAMGEGTIRISPATPVLRAVDYPGDGFLRG
jgi:hypothetical protein